MIPEAVYNGTRKGPQVNHILSLSVGLSFALAVMSPHASADPLGHIPAGRTSITVPFVLSQNHIVVSVLVNGKGPLLFLLDSGAERNVMDEALVRALKLKTNGGGHIKGFGSQSVASLQTENTTVQIGDATLPKQKFITYDFSDWKKVFGAKFAGSLGGNVFNSFVIQVNYSRPQLTLTLPTGFTYHGSGVSLPLTFSAHHVPEIEGKIEGITGKFKIDTGSGAALTLYAPFVEENGLRTKYASQSQTSTSYGAGGASKVKVVPSLLFQFGGIDTHIPVEMSLARSGIASEKDTAGSIGGWLLRSLIVTLDYSRKEIIFEPQTESDQPAPATEPEKEKKVP